MIYPSERDSYNHIFLYYEGRIYVLSETGEDSSTPGFPGVSAGEGKTLTDILDVVGTEEGLRLEDSHEKDITLHKITEEEIRRITEEGKQVYHHGGRYPLTKSAKEKILEAAESRDYTPLRHSEQAEDKVHAEIS